MNLNLPLSLAPSTLLRPNTRKKRKEKKRNHLTLYHFLNKCFIVIDDLQSLSLLLLLRLR